MANEYASLATLKEHLGIEADDVTRDGLLNSALAAASRSIDRATGRRFWLDETAAARRYTPAGRTYTDADGEHLIIDDIGHAAILVETGSGASWTTVLDTDYETGPDNALAAGRPVTSLLRLASSWGGSVGGRVRVTARWGWPSVPDEIEQATLIQAARLYRRKDSPEGVTGSAEWGVVRLSRRDPDVWMLIEPFILPSF